ncbi:hypothetical protein QYM36_004256 [Artemia franciscana]|uniref:Uncharacterized protein n=1 Tax=Artemia franciscana TaxID=6661 RepID=A0AA88LCF1_ARTSF|nr:hypothetical protein QYM36_004256 [Artemia franciscana]
MASKVAVDPTFSAVKSNQTCFHIWRAEDVVLVPIPKEEYGKFFKGDSYLLYSASERGYLRESLSGTVPPGARFDPVGQMNPDEVAPRFKMPSRSEQPRGIGMPDPDHMRMPGFGDGHDFI